MSDRAERVALHPGEILREQFMADCRISISLLARDLGVSPAMIREIVKERQPITPDIALRLARYFATTAAFWMNLQSAYEIDLAASV